MASSSSSPAKRRREEEQGPSSKWRRPRTEEAYSSKLIDALRLVRSGTITTLARGREVRDAADRALAAAARGRSRWSRAILARRRTSMLLRARLSSPMVPTSCSKSNSNSSSPPAVERKAKVLGRLVPGCRKLAFPALLAEVSDYIAALEMQVRTMNAVAQALASGGSSSPS